VSTARTIARNTFFLFLLRASGFVLSFILGMRIGRVLGSEGLGVYTLAVTYLQIFVLIPNFGFDTLAIRDLARDRAHAGRYVANMVFAKVALSLPAYALLIAVVTLFDYPPDTKAAILLLGASLLFDALAEAAAAIFQGFERMELLTAISGIAKVIVTAISIAVLERGGSIPHVLAIQLAGSILVVPIFAAMTKRLIPHIPFEIDRAFLRQLMHESFPLFVTNLIGLLYLRTDIVLLSKFHEASQVGLYGAAASVLRALSMLPGIFVTAMYPALARFSHGTDLSDSSLRRLCDTAFRWQLVLGIPISAGISALGPEIIDLVYGPAFAPAGPVLSILIWSLFFFFTNTLLGYMLFAANRQRDFLRIKIATLIINLALGFALIPRFGIEGAAWAAVATLAVSFVLHWWLVSRVLYRVNFFAIAGKPLVGAAALMLVVQSLRGGPLAVIIAAGALAFALSQILLRFVTKEDMEILRRILRRQPLQGDSP
jgi:O-antigen/teichoic acid export membrane protein